MNDPKDVTDSPEDWEDFWENEEQHPEEDDNQFVILPIDPNNIISN
ncbi:hypothetical protein Syn7803C76_61 [Synechococcus phage ACG-2014b]|jgi:hypothetical protein|uniref:Uncharacterized protein n=2 Tax=Synechococcus phage ACG-2014b TaxID=1493508 RepID=A0A0E3FSH8_9CAUD|nr:hypothetical protein ABF04_gp061 [Synechococcus phage ACG-2014b]YP_009779689.1 hypothetical protein HOQ67_gp061 [Synechococcus phage ACG-2014b]YP_009779904.1 hypothetical protein HOQ68_gp061 [Synechococcus phage ACG-2014b]AIX17283.1 hypothetical protein Syn7803C61_61 [Synechococcus phage ACG-2014b]AIX17497.1 hypothetical protein Syn7803C66_60 [Synechococcus phage ACG-2014b]AIX17711.1 hypothetical protein Syn7803C67_59 [Synechococcus phage ACG-2014b]AIX17929.1 hypothetical protein Syn7803C6